VNADDGSAGELWVTLAKPNQALTRVLAAVPEGWTAEVLTSSVTEEQQRIFSELKLNPGDLYKLPLK
jgi:hypothetical protein